MLPVRTRLRLRNGWGLALGLLWSVGSWGQVPPLAAWKAKLVPTPALATGESNLWAASNGAVYLSWVRKTEADTAHLEFAVWQAQGRWGPPQGIAQGRNWFVNWADFPSLAGFEPLQNPPQLAAHWLAKSAAGTYDYNVNVATSSDGGKTWSQPWVPHDAAPAEHGFVTLLPVGSQQMLAVWLDGRYTKASTDHAHHHGHAGAMTLRTAIFDPQGQLSDTLELDARICDCCQTDAVVHRGRVLVVYRDRSLEEVRDISLVARNSDGHWTAPQPVHQDGWITTACPVNGPAIAASDKRVAVAWYTAPDQRKQVNLAFSTDGGQTFGAPWRIDRGNPLGRVDVEMIDPQIAVVSWMEQLGGKWAALYLQAVGPNGLIGSPRRLVKLPAARISGFPILSRQNENLLLSWTKGFKRTRVQTLWLRRF